VRIEVVYMYVGRVYASDRMDLTRGNLKPKSASSILQALSCRFCRLQLSNPSKLVISKKWKSRIALHVQNDWGRFSNGLSRQNQGRLALPEMRPTLFLKIPGGGLNQTKHKQILKARNTKTSKLQPKNR